MSAALAALVAAALSWLLRTPTSSWTAEVANGPTRPTLWEACATTTAASPKRVEEGTRKGEAGRERQSQQVGPAVSAASLSVLATPRKRPLPESIRRKKTDGRTLAAKPADGMASSAGCALRRVIKKGPDCRRFKAKISYNGEGFCGWQKQGPSPDGTLLRSIEGQLEQSLRPALGQAVGFFPAGRTDAGVSATGQIVTFDAMLSPRSPVGPKPSKHLRGEELAKARQKIFAEESQTVLLDVLGQPTPPSGLAAAFNCVLPTDLQMVSVEMAARNFDPLGEARWKRYCYALDAPACFAVRKSVYWGVLQDIEEAAIAGGRLDAPAQTLGSPEANPDSKFRASHPSEPSCGDEGVRKKVPEPDDAAVPDVIVSRMQDAAHLLVGTHDFAAFQAKGGRVTTVRSIFRCCVQEDAARLVITCEGDGFLYKMVRIIAGTLLKIGMGLAPPSLVTELIETQNRRLAGPPLPARYLTLQHVEYAQRHPLDVRQADHAGSLADSVRERKRGREGEGSPALP